MATLHEVVVEAKARADEHEHDWVDTYTRGWADGVTWVLEMLAECDDIEDEALEDFV